jgi:hypothetical protein
MNSVRHGTSAVKLVWAPWSLATVAAHNSLLRAYVFGSAAVCAELGLYIAVAGVCAAEPYPTLMTVICSILLVSVITAGAPWLFTIAVVFLAHRNARAMAISRINAIRLRVLFLGPVCALAPIVVWIASYMCACVARPSFNLYRMVKPAWIQSQIFSGVAASPGWLVGVALSTTAVGAALVKVQRMRFEESFPSCRSCGYNLHGNESGVCPECGTPCQRISHTPLAEGE